MIKTFTSIATILALSCCIQLAIQPVVAVWPPPCAQFNLDDFGASYTPVAGLDYDTTTEQFVTICWINSGGSPDSPTGTGTSGTVSMISGWSASNGIMRTVYTKMAVIIAMNTATKEFFFRIHPKITTYSNTTNSQSGWGIAQLWSNITSPDVDHVPVGYTYGCAYSTVGAAIDLRDTGYILANTGAAGSVQVRCGSGSWNDDVYHAGYFRFWTANGNCAFIGWGSTCPTSTDVTQWNGGYRIELWRANQVKPSGTQSESQGQTASSWTLTTHWSLHMQQFAVYNSSSPPSSFVGSRWQIAPDRQTLGTEPVEVHTLTGYWAGYLGMIPALTALTDAGSVDNAVMKLDLSAWTAAAGGDGIGLNSGQFDFAAHTLYGCAAAGGSVISPTGPVAIAQGKILSLSVTGSKAWLSPSSNCGRVFTDITSGRGYLIPLVRSSCPTGQVLVDTGATGPQCYADCPAGSQRSTVDRFVCQPCAVDTYSATKNTACVACPTGYHTAGTGATTCAVCDYGRYKNGTSCVQCALGTYQPTLSQPSACINCAAGSYAGALGKSVCDTCAAGSYSNAAASVCTTCAVGTATGTSGSGSCLPCVAGKFAMNTNSTYCDNCLPGSFTAAPGASSCTLCPSQTYNSVASSSSCTACSTATAGIEGGIKCCAGAYTAAGLNAIQVYGTTTWAMTSLICARGQAACGSSGLTAGNQLTRAWTGAQSAYASAKTLADAGQLC